MPIRINLLAEAQAAEELRRKDPVKRAVLGAVMLGVLVGLWVTTLQMKVLGAKGDLETFQTKWKAIEKDYQAAVDRQRQSIEAEHKLMALQTMTTNRFLWGNVLNAFQQTLNDVDNLEVVRLRAEQIYTINEEAKARTNGATVVAGRPATATERITLAIDAVDRSGPQGSRIPRFKDAIAAVPWFRDNLQPTDGVMLTQRSAPTQPPNGGPPTVLFTLQCYFPVTTR